MLRLFFLFMCESCESKILFFLINRHHITRSVSGCLNESRPSLFMISVCARAHVCIYVRDGVQVGWFH